MDISLKTNQYTENQIDRSRLKPEIVAAAEGMEELFLNYMMQVMRQTVPKNDTGLESPASGIYRSLLDSEYAKSATHSQSNNSLGSLGLANQIVRYFQQSGYPVENDESQGDR